MLDDSSASLPEFQWSQIPQILNAPHNIYISLAPNLFVLRNISFRLWPVLPESYTPILQHGVFSLSASGCWGLGLLPLSACFFTSWALLFGVGHRNNWQSMWRLLWQSWFIVFLTKLFFLKNFKLTKSWKDSTVFFFSTVFKKILFLSEPLGSTLLMRYLILYFHVYFL